ncbi:MAG: phosphatase domain-containing protein [Planctomycetota bacterium]
MGSEVELAHPAPERDGYRYPLFRRNDRPLPADWSGWQYVWDIDNTYLVTEWRGLRDLLRIRFEAALDKRPVPGAVPLLRGLRRGRAADAERPAIHFVSASPHTMRDVLEQRMLIDGVVHDGIAFRDWSRLRYLRDVFGYKVAALTLLRLESPPGAREVLFGDDGEHDPWVYSLYARVCAGSLRGEELRATLREQGVGRSASRYVTALADELPQSDPVDWVFIRRLGRPAPPPEEQPAAEGEQRPRRPTTRRLRRPPPCERDPRLLEVDDYAQAATVLFAAGRIGAEDLAAVVAEVRAAQTHVGQQGAAPCAALDMAASRLDPAAVAAARAQVEELS